MLIRCLVLVCLYAVTSQAIDTSLFLPAQKKLPKGYTLDPTWKRKCLELDLTDEFDLDGDGSIDTMYIKKYPAKRGKIKSWRNIAWAQMAFKLSSSNQFIEVPALLDYLDESTGGYSNCSKGTEIVLIADTCTVAGRFKLHHGIPLGASSNGTTARNYSRDKQFYYPNFAWMDSFAIANKTTDWVNEGATNGKLSDMQKMIKYEWRRYYSFDVEKNGIRIYNIHDHINGCSDSTKSKNK
jgi:hypothetical protein